MNAISKISFKNLLDSNGLARGLAILAVVICHLPHVHAFWKPLGSFASAGKLAVSVFLFSSGLLLQFQSNRSQGVISPLPWLKKRLVKILPLYWFGLFVAGVFAWVFHGKLFDLGTVIANGLGIPLLLGKRVISTGYTGPFWFISILVLCYFLFLLVHRIRSKWLVVLGAVMVSAVALRMNLIMGAAALAFPAFFMGMVMADVWKNRGEASCDARVHLLIFIPLLVALALVFKGARFLNLPANASFWLECAGCVGLTLIPWSLLVIIAWFQKWMARTAPLFLGALFWFSSFSFAVYCLHEPLLIVLEKATLASHPWLGLVGYSIITVMVAWGVSTVEHKLRNSGTQPRKAG